MVARRGLFLFGLLAVASVLLVYTAYDKAEGTLVFGRLLDVLLFRDVDHSVGELNKVAALAGLGLLSSSMVIGPLAAIFPGVFMKYLGWRKYLGLMGFALIFAHGAYSFSAYFNLDLMRFSSPGLAAALTAFLIFSAMAVTSNGAAISKLGPRRWKILHRIGYLALALGALHFIVVETKPDIGFDVRPYGILILALPILTVTLKLAAVALKKKA